MDENGTRSDPGMGMGCAIALLLSALVVVSIWLYDAHGNHHHASQRAHRAAVAQSETGLPASNAARIMTQLRSAKAVTRQEGNDYWIDPAFWLQANALQKKETAIAIYTDYRANGGEHLFIMLYDSMSGRKLAKYGESWGFNVY